MTKKNLLVSFFIAAGLLLLAYSFYGNDIVIENGQKYSNFTNLKKVLKQDATFSNISIENITKADMSLVIFMTPKICSPCINNIVDYINIADEKLNSLNIIFLFTDHIEEEINWFMKTVKFNYPFAIIKKEHSPINLNRYQQIVFYDGKKERSFYSVNIPGNITTPISYKKEVIKQALNSM